MKKIYNLVTVLFTLGCLMFASSMMGQNLLGNPGFETGELAPWFGDNNNIVNIVTDAAVGEYAAEGNAAQNVDLEEGVEYELRCKAKIISVGADEKVWIGVRGPTALVKNSQIFEMDWEDMSIDFAAPETGTHKIWIWGQGTSSYASDGWTLVVKGTSSVNDQEAKDKIKIINGAGGVSINTTNVLSDVKIMVHDFAGRQVYQATTSQSNTLIERAVFPTSGMYVVSVMTDKIHRVEKVAMMGY